MTVDKFPHLNNSEPKPENILKIPVEDINDMHLATLKCDLNDNFSKSCNPEVVKALKLIIWKIDKISSLWKPERSWEIMRAANDNNYWLNQAA